MKSESLEGFREFTIVFIVIGNCCAKKKNLLNEKMKTVSRSFKSFSVKFSSKKKKKKTKKIN